MALIHFNDDIRRTLEYFFEIFQHNMDISFYMRINLKSAPKSMSSKIFERGFCEVFDHLLHQGRSYIYFVLLSIFHISLPYD
jgi:hypothetical protein